MTKKKILALIILSPVILLVAPLMLLAFILIFPFAWALNKLADDKLF